MIHSLVSIIVPIYKVESYLQRCLDSIVNQSYTNLEIILVDDGSPDACPQICDEYATRDNRIVVIHKNNGGLSDARNAGLDISKGKYISFVDSDDWIDTQYVETLLALITTENSDIAFGENKPFYTNYSTRDKKKQYFVTNYTQLESLEALFSKNLVSHTVSWGKLYKRELFINVRFPVGRFHEDEFTTYILFSKSSKITYTNACLYYYRQRANSITSSAHNEDFICAREQQLAFFKRYHFESVAPLVLEKLCWLQLRTFFDQRKRNNNHIENILADLRKKTNDKDFKKIGFVHRQSLKFFSLYPHLYLTYRNLSQSLNSILGKMFLHR